MGKKRSKKMLLYKRKVKKTNKSIEEIVYETDEKNAEIQEIIEAEIIEIPEKIEEDTSFEKRRENFQNQLRNKAQNFNDRREAQEKDKQRSDKLQKAIAKLERKMTKEELKNEEEIEQFFSDIKKKTDKYLNKQKGQKDKNKQKESKNKTKQARISGTSMKDIFGSDKFKEIYQESEKESEER